MRNGKKYCGRWEEVKDSCGLFPQVKDFVNEKVPEECSFKLVLEKGRLKVVGECSHCGACCKGCPYLVQEVNK